MERKTIYLCLAHMSEEGLEQKYVKEAFDTNWVVPLGPNVNAFEEDLKTFVNSQENGSENPNREIVALSAGTAAIHLALIACGVQAGDEVICQSFTFCASANPVTYIGATPVFIDSEKDSWNMDPAMLEQAILDRKAKTGKYPKAIIPVALYGMPYRIEEIMAIANKYGIPVIEDAAEGMGSRWKGRVIGTFGNYGVLSFNGNKMITTSGGGALICKDAEAKNKIMWLATQAREAYPYYQHETIGFNYRLSNICAGIGRGQMTVLNDHLAHHKHVQARYKELLKDVPGIHLHEAPNADFDANYWLCTITIDPEVRIKGQENAYKETVKSAVGGAAGVIHMVDSPTTDCQPNENVEALRVYMLEHKIEARPVWKPMHKQPVFKNSPAYINGVSEAIFKIGMCLPAGPMVSDEDIEYIVETIKSAIV
ncbi:MAG: aminotransferase class I/II-fold pyridoxal phosphate-dependent enzyme [Paludibacteraceae bacterium]|nr:aminotransferase class I/II-fold pyridoxal phosphate-dependent enzyme [Paludibacteraceae bacterium]